jgi:hypothetical protein
MPNPTASSPTPNFGSWEAPAAARSSSYGGGGGGGGFVGASPAFTTQSLGAWMWKLGVAGAVLGALAGLARALLLHLPSQAMGFEVARLALAVAAAGAGVPPAIRAASFVLRAALWFVLAIVLWGIALSASGLLGSLARFR